MVQKKTLIDKNELLNIDNIALMVIKYLGQEYVQKGNYTFIHCPGHEKILGKVDENIGNCYLTSHGYHCCACNETKNVFDMTMEILNCNFAEAIKIVADAAGGAELFETDSIQIKEKQMPLSYEDLELIGLKNNNEMPILNGSDREEFDEDYICSKTEDGEYLIYNKGQALSLIELFKTNKDIYNKLIVRKSREAMKKYQLALDAFCERDSKKADIVFELMSVDNSLSNKDLVGIKNAFQKKYWKSKEIYDKFSVKV